MRRSAFCVALVLAVAGAGASARETEKISQAAVTPPPPPAAPAPASTNWMISETRSPVDYSPVATATASQADLQVSIQCRGGRAEMVVAGTTTIFRVGEHSASYGVNDAPPVGLALGPSSSGNGLALKADVQRFLKELPERGEVVFRVMSRRGESLQGRFDLAAMKKLLRRLAAPCKWPTD